jgi:hypothetical protein
MKNLGLITVILVLFKICTAHGIITNADKACLKQFDLMCVDAVTNYTGDDYKPNDESCIKNLGFTCKEAVAQGLFCWYDELLVFDDKKRLVGILDEKIVSRITQKDPDLLVEYKFYLQCKSDGYSSHYHFNEKFSSAKIRPLALKGHSLLDSIRIIQRRIRQNSRKIYVEDLNCSMLVDIWHDIQDSVKKNNYRECILAKNPDEKVEMFTLDEKNPGTVCLTKKKPNCGKDTVFGISLRKSIIGGYKFNIQEHSGGHK